MIIDQPEQQQLKNFTFAVYILQALSFLTLVSALIGIVVNYVKQDDVRGSWLQSHFRWQQATFWYGLMWMALGILTMPVLVGYAVLGILPIWLIYRIARGWICLVDGKAMYDTNNGATND
jgi:uncharacterized membrane protein